jgi:hypothetical protein
MSLINKPQALDKQCMAIGLHRQTNIIHILIQNDGEEQKQHPLNSGHQKLTTSSLSLSTAVPGANPSISQMLGIHSAR